MRGLKEIYRQIIEDKEYKFLGFFDHENLKLLEELLDTDLGIRGRKEVGKEPRKGRPFIGRKRGNSLEVCFLTRDKKKYRIELDLCEKKDPSCSRIEDVSYVFYDRKRGYGKFLFKDIGELNYTLCGRCEDLEIIDKLRVFEV